MPKLLGSCHAFNVSGGGGWGGIITSLACPHIRDATYLRSLAYPHVRHATPT